MMSSSRAGASNQPLTPVMSPAVSTWLLSPQESHYMSGKGVSERSVITHTHVERQTQTHTHTHTHIHKEPAACMKLQLDKTIKLGTRQCIGWYRNLVNLESAQSVYLSVCLSASLSVSPASAFSDATAFTQHQPDWCLRLCVVQT